MYVCMCVCVCMYICMYVCMCVHVCVNKEYKNNISLTILYTNIYVANKFFLTVIPFNLALYGHFIKH